MYMYSTYYKDTVLYSVQYTELDWSEVLYMYIVMYNTCMVLYEYECEYEYSTSSSMLMLCQAHSYCSKILVHAVSWCSRRVETVAETVPLPVYSTSTA